MLLFINPSPERKACRINIQIHLMLLFIFLPSVRLHFQIEFKYISCYCLSPLKFFRILWMWYSNTSHVIVYPLRLRYSPGPLYSNTSHVIVYLGNKRGSLHRTETFKYISCYCLSNIKQSSGLSLSIQIHLMLLFILPPSRKERKKNNSNTSHVIVYHAVCFGQDPFSLHSNTSHVIVYQPFLTWPPTGTVIQIHLMLLFILV